MPKKYNNGMPATVPMAMPSTLTRARSPTRRIPRIKVDCALDTVVRSKAMANQPRCRQHVHHLPKVNWAMGCRKTKKSSAPSTPKTSAIRRKAITVRAIQASSPLPAASAIWRTPLVARPIPARVASQSKRCIEKSH
jgi:hypothetical protein